jgi:pyruvate/oxaloacetate carboxyltransferase
LVSFTRLGIPIIVSLIIGGLISFLLVFNFYPEKHENIQIDGKCYELTGDAHKAYNSLISQSKKNSMVSQINKIENMNASIPITFVGQNTEIDDFIDKYQILVTTRDNITLFPNIAGSVISGNISGVTLSSIINKLDLNDLSRTSKSIIGSLAIIPNSQITSQEFKDVSKVQYKFIQDGLRKIIKNLDGASPAECRYQVDEPNS